MKALKYGDVVKQLAEYKDGEYEDSTIKLRNYFILTIFDIKDEFLVSADFFDTMDEAQSMKNEIKSDWTMPRYVITILSFEL